MRCRRFFRFLSSVDAGMPVAVQAENIIAKEVSIKTETGKVAKQGKGSAADLDMMTISLIDYLTAVIVADLLYQKQNIEIRLKRGFWANANNYFRSP